MHRLLFKLSILATLSIFVSSCLLSQSAIPTIVTETITAFPTITPLPTSTPTSTPQPTQTSTITPIPIAIIRVPEDQPTIQAGIDAAQEGDLVLVAPGTYSEQLIISKTITLASHFHVTGDEQFINNTIIDGSRHTVIEVANTVGPDTRIIGFTIQNGEDGIHAFGKLQILNNRFLHNKDAVDYEKSGGLNSGNVYENNTDDGIDLDGATEIIIENNLIRDNGDDGIEIRLHKYRGPNLNIIIRGNTISRNKDGIQMIDYPDVSNRVFIIERNLIESNTGAGLGLLDNGDGEEYQDFRGASIPEPIQLFNNIFTDNLYSVSGGDNLTALNNLFLNSTVLALNNVDGNSIAAYNLFWNNATDSQGSNIDPDTTLFSDPLLDANYQLQPGSPAIDRGIALFEWKGEIVLELPLSAYFGSAPDLGVHESTFTQTSHRPYAVGVLIPGIP